MEQSPSINCKLHATAIDFIFVGLFDHLTVLFVCSLLYPQCPSQCLAEGKHLGNICGRKEGSGEEGRGGRSSLALSRRPPKPVCWGRFKEVRGHPTSAPLIPSGHRDSPHFTDMETETREKQELPKGTMNQCRGWACPGLDYVCF